MRSIEVIDISYIENEAYRAFRRASQLSVTSIKAMLAITVPFIGTLNVCSAQREHYYFRSASTSEEVVLISYIGYVFSLPSLY